MTFCLFKGPARAFPAIAIAALFLFASPPSFAQVEVKSRDGNDVMFSADQLTYHQDIGVIVASGNVEVTHGDELLVADSLSYDEKRDTITAQGNVRYLQSSGNVLFSEFFELTSDFKTGTAKNIMLLMTDDSRAAAHSATREAGSFTTFHKAVYSPCRACEESPGRPLVWQVKAEEVRHDEKRQIVEYKDAFLEFFGVPVLYTPYLAHPDPNKKRESGFLAPSFTSNSDLGFRLRTPYYFNIAPDRDLTVAPQFFLTEQQLLLEGEYRQRTTRGEYSLAASGTYVDSGSKGATSAGKQQFRGHIEGKGEFDIDDTWRWGFDAARATDDTYMRRYDFGDEQTLTSNVYAEGFRGRNYASANIYSFQNLRYNRNEDEVPDITALANFSHTGEPSRHGAFWKLDASTLLLSRKKGTDSYRGDIKAGWHLPYTSPAGEVYELFATIEGTGYIVGDHSNPNLGDYDGAAGRVLPQIGLSWRYPLARTHGSTTEVFEPMAAVIAAPTITNSWKIPNEDSIDFDFNDAILFEPNRHSGIDRIEGGQRVVYGATWGAYGSRGGSSHLFLGQSYNLKDDSTFGEKSGLEDRFSDIVGRAQIAPSGFMNLEYRFRADRSSLQIRKSEANLSVGPTALKLDLNYTFIDADADTGDYGDREEISTSLNTRLTRYWSASAFGSRRLSDPGGMLSSGLGLRYLDECLEFRMRLDRTYYNDRDLRPNDTISFQFVLRNLGEFTGPSVSN
ncbi:MAG: LPS assembly protein LptD [Rhodospirillales bacterium]|nr:LPS assembly protein LptD [Rhodospirillales bacterium]